VLPCYWIYWEVGKALEQKGSPDPLYTRWIGTYASAEFGGAVEAVLECTNTMARDLDRAGRDAMLRHFVPTSRYQRMFWEMGYRQEPWPIWPISGRIDRRAPLGVPLRARASPAQPNSGGRFGRGAEPPSEFLL